MMSGLLLSQTDQSEQREWLSVSVFFKKDIVGL